MLIPFKDLVHRHGVQASGVLHLGANSGQEANDYAAEGVRRVIWVEAIPSLIPKLTQCAQRFPGAVVLQACVGERDGEPVLFHVASNEGQSSSIYELGTHAEEYPWVKYVAELPIATVRVDTLLRGRGIALDGDAWFLNADLQGAELVALKGMGELLKRFQWVYAEVNERELYKGCPKAPEVDEYLARFGFVTVETKMTEAGWGDRFYARAGLTSGAGRA